MSVYLEGSTVHITCENVPWEDTPDRRTEVPEFIGNRRWAGPFDPTPEDLARHRRVLWGVVQLALAGVVPDETLFRSSGSARSFTLRPASPSSVPLQRVHVGAGTIPNSLADIPCAGMTASDLLDQLNSVMGTKRKLRAPGLQDLLEDIRSTACDFGEAYGMLRPWWSKDSPTILQDLEKRKREASQMREVAILESSIRSSNIPPRRVWDLYSNRVVPLYILPEASILFFPDYLWTVSHSWATDDDQVKVWTNINGKHWPVPIPRGTTLDHVRIELLNMGAEYVWMDILCLRQKGADTDEGTRREEWKIDVPTIGQIYRGMPTCRPCVVYFNGLGRPLDTSPELFESDRHWFNRVWTLQESLKTWLPGGLTGEPLAGSRDFFNRLDNLVKSMSGEKEQAELVQDLTRRHCTKELDKIGGLAYVLNCSSLPVYDESSSVESAWALLIKHMPPGECVRIFLEYGADSPFGLWISWSGFIKPLQPLPSLPYFYPKNVRKLRAPRVEPEVTKERGLACPGQIIGPCAIVREPQKGVDDGTVRLDVGRDSIRFRPSRIHGVFLPDISYSLVIVSPWKLQNWVVVEVVKESGGQEPKVDVVKWGVIRASADGARALHRLPTGDGAMVTYLDGEEAQRRSAYTKRYMEAFTKMQGKGETVTFGE